MTPWQNPQLSTVFGRSMKCSRRCSMRRRNVTGLPARPGHWGAVASPSSRPRPGSLALRSAVVSPNSTPAPPAAMIPTPSTCASAAPVVAASAHINRKVRSFQRRRQPVISVDTKKKELIGNYKNPGREWEPESQPRRVKSKDFPDKVLGKVAPYGVYDLTVNEGWVNVGITHDPAAFAVESIRRWWNRMGHQVYPEARELLVTADSGGSNGSRSRLWKVCLQGLANELGPQISVCHFPPGTSKWNKIEHRMFCHITENWRGRPLVSHAVVVNLIGNTQTRARLRIQAELDTNSYETGIKVNNKY